MASCMNRTAFVGAQAKRPIRSVCARATWQKLTTTDELKAKGGRVVVKTEGGDKVLIQEYNGYVYAVSNKCPHLGLPIQGRIMGQPMQGSCVVCPFHNTAFDIETGEVQGEWCPKMPNLPIVGKGGEKKPLPTFETRVADGVVEVMA